MKRQDLFHKKKRKTLKQLPYGIPESNLFVSFSIKCLVVTIIYCRFAAVFLRRSAYAEEKG